MASASPRWASIQPTGNSIIVWIWPVGNSDIVQAASPPVQAGLLILIFSPFLSLSMWLLQRIIGIKRQVAPCSLAECRSNISSHAEEADSCAFTLNSAQACNRSRDCRGKQACWFFSPSPAHPPDDFKVAFLCVCAAIFRFLHCPISQRWCCDTDQLLDEQTSHAH